MPGITVGFPTTLTYFLHYPFWNTFFSELGCKLLSSPPTNKAILDLGVKETVTDACIPIKLFHGHAAYIKEKVDYLFIPRMVNVDREKHITFCPKFLGLPDMVRASISNIPPIIEAKIDRKQGPFYVFKACRSIGEHFGKNLLEVFKAYYRASGVQKGFDRLLVKEGLTVPEGLEVLYNNAALKDFHHKSDLNIAVIGYPYQIYDSYVSAGLLDKLKEQGARIWTMEMVPYTVLQRQARHLKKKLFWYFSNKVVWSGYHYLEQPFINGIIHVTAFGCGPDAMVDKLMELECKHRGFPFLSIMVDEQTGEGGISTRIEAFLDMIRYRRGLDESIIPVHGDIAHRL